VKLASACLLGITCRWDGNSNVNDKVLKLAQRELLVPVCPEQLGRLPTPRDRQEIQDGSGESVLDNKSHVVTSTGRDVTAQFLRGAQETLKIARLLGIREFIGKAGSPSCGCGRTYNGSFSGKPTSGNGVTAALLQRNGIKLMSEDELL
jgi:uncharacterized protein YbbK (DUF523 family)